MDFGQFLNDLRASPAYQGQIVYTRRVDEREAVCADTSAPLSNGCRAYLTNSGIDRLYSHQARAIDLTRDGRDVLIVTGTASGKSVWIEQQLPQNAPFPIVLLEKAFVVRTGFSPAATT